MLSIAQKLQVLRKQSPELFDLVEELGSTVGVVHDLEKQFGGCPDGTLSERLAHLQYSARMAYCINVLFYLAMKTHGAVVREHPVVTELVKLRSLIDSFEGTTAAVQRLSQTMDVAEEVNDGDSDANSELETSLPEEQEFKSDEDEHEGAVFSKYLEAGRSVNSKATQSRRLLELVDFGEEQVKERRPRSKPTSRENSAEAIDEVDEDDVEESDSWNEMEHTLSADEKDYTDDEEMQTIGATENVASSEEDNSEADSKRAISKTILKNRGLVPHRRRDQQNPRVKMRRKFKKAKNRMTGVRRTIKSQDRPYGGEASGIKRNLTRSIKISH